MRCLVLLALCLAGATAAHAGDESRWRREARSISITRDTWGIAHVRAHTDAGAVFGAMYAQAEDDFGRVERNYLVALGWLARAEGASAVYADLRQRLFVDPDELQRLYRGVPPWLRALMIGWADGLNFYLATHPGTRPKVVRHFEPWMALSFTEGSIGGDIETVDLGRLREFYDPAAAPRTAADRPEATEEPAPGGSNGFAIAPRLSATGHALLWINPHTTFYFRSEMQLVSDQGLDVYGAATWGQFFIYQGFNSHNGWMHTSYGGDAIDEYSETVSRKGAGLVYAYGTGSRPVSVGHIVIRCRRDDGAEEERRFTVYRTHHGPVVRSEGGEWIAVRLFSDPVKALTQSYLRTKTRNYLQFRRIQDLRTDTSNNTVYADADGTIAYFHGNFIPRRDPRFDFTHPVDGSNPATEWRGPHALSETITLLNPPNGWIQNTNDWPFSAAGPASPRRTDYPAYMWTKAENPRGIHAVEVLQGLRDVTLDGLIAAAYDGHLTAFDTLLPPLLAAYDGLAPADPRRAALREPIAELRRWDRRTGVASEPTTLAIYWGDALVGMKGAAASRAGVPVYDFLVGNLSDAERLEALEAALRVLGRDFGAWRVAWGDVNRFQRLTDDLVQPFDDAKPSLPVGFAPSLWGALASFDGDKPRVTKRIYGSKGNSFVAAVEFGAPVRAVAIMSGGASGDPSSPHFNDQGPRFARGEFRDVWLTPGDVAAHAERTYHPGE